MRRQQQRLLADQVAQGVAYFQRFMALNNQPLQYLAPYCQNLLKLGAAQQAADLYDVYCQMHPQQASFAYNRAYYLRFAGAYQAAIDSYHKAIALHISEPEEIYLNIAVIYSDHLRQEKEAEQALLKALALKPNYIPALYNLANLAEEWGDKARAESLFRQIISLDGHYYQAYARLADVVKFQDAHDPVILAMLNGLALKDGPNTQGGLDLSTRINLHFALGKAFDDCGAYEQAFQHYQQGNELNSQTMPAYEPEVFERYISDIIHTFDASWLQQHGECSLSSPVFICGMFRSGSTLLEQILGQHSKVTPGGEIDYFVRVLGKGFPQDFAAPNAAQLAELAEGYQAYCQERFPNATLLTDKRPDNYLYLGLLKALFPKAKFVVTRRHPVDNQLSVYFTRLEGRMNYANNLDHIAHNYQQHERLVQHWQQLFGDDIYVLDYDALVQAPQATLEPLLAFLGLEYEAALLDFNKANNAVKTASVWQVRQPLYKHASGRHKNYQAFL